MSGEIKKKKSIATNATFNVAYKMLNILFPIITTAYLSRILGPVYLGKVSYAHSIMSYFLVVASLGIPTHGLREIARAGNDIDTRNKVFSELFTINLVSSIVCSIIYTFCILNFNNMRAELGLYLCTGLTLYMNVLNIDWFYSGQEEYVYITVRSLIVKVISLICILLLIRDQKHYVYYALITSLATTGNYLFNVYNIRNKVHYTIRGLDLKVHMKSILILLVTLLATDLYNQVDITMIGAIRSEAEVGYYSNGIKLVRMVYSITTAISATTIPRMSQYYKEKRSSEYSNLFWKAMKTILIIAVPAVIGILMLSKEIVYTLFGAEFEASIPVINVLAILIIIISVSYLSGSVVLTSSHNEKYLLLATVSGCVVNIILNSLFIPRFGIIGAAIASIAAEIVVAIIHIKYGLKYVKNNYTTKEIFSIAISSGIMALVIIGLKSMISATIPRLIVCIGSGVVVYFIVLIILRNEIVLDYIQKIKRKIAR